MSFLKDLERGKIGEEIFIKQARHYFGKDRVMDLRGTVIERAYDVDFATPWSNYDYNCLDWCKVEVKTDYQARWTIIIVIAPRCRKIYVVSPFYNGSS